MMMTRLGTLQMKRMITPCTIQYQYNKLEGHQPSQQFYSMRSSCPHIIKHYIPLSFSQNAIDLPSTLPKKEFVPNEDNPLQNIKLKHMDKQQNKKFIVTFNNHTHKTYQPKKQLTYKQLFGTLKEEQQKMKLIMKAVEKNHKEEQGRLKRENLRYDKEQNERVPEVRRPRTVTLRRSRSKVQQKAETMENSHFLMRNIHSSSTGRLYRTRTSLPSQLILLPQNPEPSKPLSLRIRGSKAPETEMVDHLKRHSLKQLRRWEFY